MIKTLKKVEPLQMGKILGIVNALGSLIFMPFFGVISFLATLLNRSQNESVIGALVAFVIMCLVLPLVYAVMGFIAGVVGSWIYNLVAAWVGGIRVEVE